MFESEVGLIAPATLQNAGKLAKTSPSGAVKVPAGTDCAAVIVVFGSASPAMLPQSAAAVIEPNTSKGPAQAKGATRKRMKVLLPLVTFLFDGRQPSDSVLNSKASIAITLLVDGELAVPNVDEYRRSIQSRNGARLRQRVSNGQEERFGRHIREDGQRFAIQRREQLIVVRREENVWVEQVHEIEGDGNLEAREILHVVSDDGQVDALERVHGRLKGRRGRTAAIEPQQAIAGVEGKEIGDRALCKDARIERASSDDRCGRFEIDRIERWILHAGIKI